MLRTFDGIRLRNASRQLGAKTTAKSQPRRTIASGYVSSVSTDTSGKITTAIVQIPGSGSVRAQVPYGANVYTRMGVQIENYGSPSNASWVIAGSTYLPTGSTGGVIVNQNGNIIAMFESIWVRDEGYVLVGGVEDPDGNPTGPRVQLVDTGIFGWDSYDRQMLSIYTRDVGEQHLAGDIDIGYSDGGRIEMSAQDSSFGIWNVNDMVLLFSPENGNRITKNLWVGDEPGPQIGIGKLDNESFIVARNYGSGDMNSPGNEAKFLVSAKPEKVTFHVGDPDHTSSYIFYDSEGSSEQTGIITVDALLNAREINIFGPGLVAEGGYISAQSAMSDAGIWLRDKYLEGRGNDGNRTFLLTAATVTLDISPVDPSYGAITWDGGSCYIGNILGSHFRWKREGANTVLGLFQGDDAKVYFDRLGNAVLDGTVYAWNGDAVLGREGHGIEVPILSGEPDVVQKLVSFVNNTQDFVFRAGLWSSSWEDVDAEAEMASSTISVTLGVWPTVPLPGARAYTRLLAYSEAGKEAHIRILAAGNDNASDSAMIELWSYRGDSATAWNHSRISLNANAVWFHQTDTEPTATTPFSIPNGLVVYPDTAGWNPYSYIGGHYMMARLNGGWAPFAQAWATTRRFGAATTNYLEIDGAGSMTFTGSAFVVPKYQTETQNSGSDFTISKTYTRVNCNGGNRIATLPTAASRARERFVVKKIDNTAFTVTIDGDGSELIDGVTTYVLTLYNQSVEIISTGSAWEIVGKA